MAFSRSLDARKRSADYIWKSFRLHPWAIWITSGSHIGSKFHKAYGRQWPESEKWTPKAAYRCRMAHAMHIISPCVRPKRAHKQNIPIFPTYFEGSGGVQGRQPNEQVSDPDRMGGGRGRVNPPRRSSAWRFWRFGGFGVGSKHLHAERPEASAD